MASRLGSVGNSGRSVTEALLPFSPAFEQDEDGSRDQSQSQDDADLKIPSA